jgi:hypothetical protein
MGFVKKMFKPKAPKQVEQAKAPEVIKSDPLADQAKIEAEAAAKATLESNAEIAARKKRKTSLLASAGGGGGEGQMASVLSYGKNTLGA